MSIDVKREGNYELFETTEKHRILVLDQQDYYSLVEGDYGLIIVLSDADHKKDKTLAKGDYVLMTPRNDPDWKDNVDHLELKQGKDKYRTYILPKGLPTAKDKQKKIVETEDFVKAEKLT